MELAQWQLLAPDEERDKWIVVLIKLRLIRTRIVYVRKQAQPPLIVPALLGQVTPLGEQALKVLNLLTRLKVLKG